MSGIVYFSALWNRQKMLLVVWLPKHYHFHITVFLLCVTGIRKLWQHACMKHLNQFINVTVLYKNSMASVKLKILKSTLSLNSVPISYLRITKHLNCTKCSPSRIFINIIDLFHHHIEIEFPSNLPQVHVQLDTTLLSSPQEGLWGINTPVTESTTAFLKFLYVLGSGMCCSAWSWFFKVKERTIEHGSIWKEAWQSVSVPQCKQTETAV